MASGLPANRGNPASLLGLFSLAHWEIAKVVLYLVINVKFVKLELTNVMLFGKYCYIVQLSYLFLAFVVPLNVTSSLNQFVYIYIYIDEYLFNLNYI